MKYIFLVLALIVSFLVLTKQLPDIHAPNTTNAETVNLWSNWFQDQRVPPLAERLAALETQQHRLTAIAEQLPKPAELETQQHRLTAIEEQLPKLAETETRLNLLARQEPPSTRLENGSFLAKKADTEWQLLDMFSRLRQYRRPLLFSRTFLVPPRVMLGITLIDLPGEKVRLLARAEEITIQGFTLVLETRSDNRVEEVQVDWLAFSTGSAPPTMGTDAPDRLVK